MSEPSVSGVVVHALPTHEGVELIWRCLLRFEGPGCHALAIQDLRRTRWQAPLRVGDACEVYEAVLHTHAATYPRLGKLREAPETRLATSTSYEPPTSYDPPGHAA
jgi:hypothetical protein